MRELQVLSALDGAAALPRREKLNLAELLAAAVENVAFECEGRSHGIRLTVPAEPVTTLGDPGLLQRAVENVLRNALFYTPQGTQVEMTLARQGGSAHVAVRDHGPGVPEAALPHLFDPFYRVDESPVRATPEGSASASPFSSAPSPCTASATNAAPSGLRICIDLPFSETGFPV